MKIVLTTVTFLMLLTLAGCTEEISVVDKGQIIVNITDKENIHQLIIGCTETSPCFENAKPMDEKIAQAILNEQKQQGNKHRACTTIYGGPETAEITGTVKGKEINMTINRADGCGIEAWNKIISPYWK